MRSNIFVSSLILLAPALADISPIQSSKLDADLNAYFASVTADPQYGSLYSAAVSGPSSAAIQKAAEALGSALANGQPVNSVPVITDIPSEMVPFATQVAGGFADVVNTDLGSLAPSYVMAAVTGMSTGASTAMPTISPTGFATSGMPSNSANGTAKATNGSSLSVGSQAPTSSPSPSTTKPANGAARGAVGMGVGLAAMGAGVFLFL